MTAKEAKAIADAKNSVIETLFYKGVQKIIEKDASIGLYHSSITMPNNLVGKPLMEIIKILKAQDFKVEISVPLLSDEHTLEIDWSKEYNNETDSI